MMWLFNEIEQKVHSDSAKCINMADDLRGLQVLKCTIYYITQN
jgi:hypothetical protein